jgi:hypothetical protein
MAPVEKEHRHRALGQLLAIVALTTDGAAPRSNTARQNKAAKMGLEFASTIKRHLLWPP